MDGSDGFVIEGTIAQQFSGFGVGGVGDINGELVILANALDPSDLFRGVGPHPQTVWRRNSPCPTPTTRTTLPSASNVDN